MLENLEILDAKDNRLLKLPLEFGCLAKLLRLNLDGNQLQVIPAGLGNLQTLSDLSIACNKLFSVENDALVNLRNLVHLDLHQNAFEDFSAVPASKKLDTLNLAYNQIETISNLENATNLTVLDLYNNKLSVLPESLLNMTKLKTLNISNNNLNEINPRIALIDELVRINIEGNPLRSIKPAMRNAEAFQLKKYLKMRLGEAEADHEEMKQAAAQNLPNSSGRPD